MKKYLTPIAAFAGGGLAVFSFLALDGCGGSSEGGGGSVLAVINKDTVTMEDLYEYLMSKPSVRVQTQNGVAEARVAESLAFQGLQDLVARQVTLQLAKDEGVYPDDAAVLKELEFRKKLNPNFLVQLTRAGLTVERIKQSLTLDLAREKLLTKGVTVTPKEADDFIKANPKQFMEPATADMLWVFVKSDADKAKVDAALRSGQTFSAVAVQMSDFPGARQANGRFPQRDVAQLQPQLRAMVEKTPEGRATDWLKLADGHAKFYVEKKAAAKAIEMTAERKEMVRRQLAQQRGAQAMDLGKRVLDKLMKSQIDVKERSLVEAWERAFERFKEEQKVEVPTGEGAAPEGPTK